MAHYAFLDENNIVVEVITGKDEHDLDEGVASWEEWYGNFRGKRCLRTSYNTRGNQHISGGTPFRYNYAVVGGYYDEAKDGFIPPKPYLSWVLDENTLTWVAPKSRPDDGQGYIWSEESVDWILFDPWAV